MRAEIKDMWSPDVDDLEAYQPEDSDCFGLALDLMIGPHELDGMESFQLTLCTPQWLIGKYSRDDVIIGRHFLIVFEYNYDRIVHRIRSYVEHCTGDTWHEVAEKVARLGLWEFEDYVPYTEK
jgi:hypothetical protein